MNELLSSQEIAYLKNTLERHVELHFEELAVCAFKRADIQWIKWSDIHQCDSFAPGTIVIPVLSRDEVHLVKSTPWDVEFDSSTLTLWGRLPCPDGWSEKSPDCLWFSNSNGVYLAAWDIAGILFNLLTLAEELSCNERDRHGRFIGQMSERESSGLLTVPIFNNAAAVIVQRCVLNFHAGVPFSKLVKPLRICLSHDLDQLRGNDFWTQLSNVVKLIRPVVSFKLPNAYYLRMLIRGYLTPRVDYMDHLLSMAKVEKEFGFKSIMYVLNGWKGRFGARTSSKFISKYLSEIPSECRIGIHYNYNTHLDKSAFLHQKKELEKMVGYPIRSGRAHYLRMDSHCSFKFWSENGIKYDETLGFPDVIGYRAGIAGPFKPFDRARQKELPITSLPLIAMDSCVLDLDSFPGLQDFERIVSQLSIVGGTFSLLFHPGQCVDSDIYRRLLDIFHKYNAVSVFPEELV
jgi:hypothetical protein